MLQKRWINLSILNLCVVALLGVLLRSKMIFDLPWIDYNRLVDTHGHFAFSGWVGFTLLMLLVYELPGALYSKRVYQYLLGAVMLCSWTELLTGPFESLKAISEYVSIVYTSITYVFSFWLIKDILKSPSSRTVKLLSVSSLLCLVLSSIGTWMLAYLFSVKSLNAILYRDALFGYLHLQYNGFFTLAVFALIYNKVVSNTSEASRKSIHRFGVLLSLSVLPSMFLTFLWHQPTPAFHFISAAGGILLILTLGYFLFSAPLLRKEFLLIQPSIRYMALLSISAFLVKIALQSLTYLDTINVLVFGNRPMIMCFLHLVFLGLVSLFIICYYAQQGVFKANKPIVKFSMAVFTLGIIINETLLMLQGVGNMLIAGNPKFPWYLWEAGLLLLAGTLLLAISRIISQR